MEQQNLTVLTLLDFSNAFNTVDFDILLSVLCSHNISPAVINWFRSYLYGRRQRIRIEDTFSAWCDTSAGVPQGGVLSPLLFSIFINSITVPLSSSYHLYADDLQIYTQAPLSGLPGAIDITNRDLESISDWSRSYGLKVNPTKTQTIIIGSQWYVSRINHASLPQITFDGIPIPFSQKVKNLGVIFDECFSWKPHVSEVSRKVFGAYGSLKRLKNLLPTKTKILLAHSLLLPILDYADVCYPDLTVQLLHKLERLQNLCIRFIFGLRKYDHVSHYRSQLQWLPISRRRDCHILSLLYCVLSNPNTPPYLKERFVFHSSTLARNLRASDSLTLNIPPHKTDFYAKSFTVRAIKLWNSLPEVVRRAPSVTTFKDRVKTHFLSEIVV
ncbi:hypothetical protein O0L34_g14498 [Tuta absoluta]|nr:hypothetical protein O0L34_g14498 [Tuta absoluta]